MHKTENALIIAQYHQAVPPMRIYNKSVVVHSITDINIVLTAIHQPLLTTAYTQTGSITHPEG